MRRCHAACQPEWQSARSALDAMKLFDVLVAFASLSLLLLIGMALRQRLRWLRQLGIPEALVAGLLGMSW